ncbi:putative RNA polymerase II subunit B1 CTD phosphatase rpap2 [Salvelinus namaycush]|uniref:RNA polymerase II subunit B1 CTD phosphatase RPAP2 homolog n=1 Tax=Salvelinus namaycush TaxID=8040 RepID=A0A8U1BS92_SALNM|nr:putative RNA polymerase II subunit B1 CTD phosphatase rpap2 [Salvelinus namaycush]
MENEPRKRVARSSKPGKRDGKSVKEAQAAAEEARRREAVRETLREKLDLEKRALQVVERLLEDSVADDFLVDCARLITAANYKDTVEERSIVKLCGYPVCSNKLGKVSTQQFKISTKTNKVYDITERKSFCSNFCYKASKSFELQISKSPLWLRQHESPPDVKLMKKGDGGSTGEEVRLAERRLREDDVENPLPLDFVSPEAPEDPRRSPTAGHSDDSDAEHDFVSSVVSQRRGPRVHWGDLPKRTAEGQGREPGEGEDKERRSGGKDTTVPKQIQTNEAEDKEEENTEESQKAQRKPSNGTDGHQQHTTDTNHQSEQQSFLGERGSPEGQSMEEAAELLSQVTIQDRNPATATSPALTACSVQNQDPAPNRSPQGAPAQPTQPGINITQVGMSRRGAQGLRGLLKCHEAGTKPVSVRLNLLEGLRRTFTEWMTEETMKFLYGPDHFSKTLIETKEEKEKEKEEELDEDDLEDIVKDGGEERETDSQGGPGRPSAPAPDYDTLRRETEEMGLRVREFYKGTKEVQRVSGKQHARDEDSENQGGALPLVDSHSQHLIQKRITVEKLTKGLRDIVGPLRLTMTDVSSDLNRLVRTFRFTNTNIIHKGPEWTLIAVVLLHLLSEVSPVVREALERPASVDYLSTLMQELPLLDQDLQSLVQLLRTAELCPHEHTEKRQTNQ